MTTINIKKHNRREEKPAQSVTTLLPGIVTSRHSMRADTLRESRDTDTTECKRTGQTRAGHDRVVHNRIEYRREEEKECGPYPKRIVLICVLQLCVSEVLKLVRPLIQPVLQPLYLVCNGVNACVSYNIPIHQGSVPHL
jgi:hypothetical protein